MSGVLKRWDPGSQQWFPVGLPENVVTREEMDEAISNATSRRGALVQLGSDQSIANDTQTLLSWGSAVYDTDSFFASGSPTRLTVPSGVTVVRVTVAVTWASNSTGRREHEQLVNSGFPIGRAAAIVNATSGAGTRITMTSAPMGVAGGDFIEVRVRQTSGGALAVQSASTTWFAVEVVE